MAPSVEQFVHSIFSSAQPLSMKPKHVQHEMTLVHGFPSIDSPTLLQHLHCTCMLTRTMHGRVADSASLEKCTELEGNVQTHAAGYNTSSVIFTANSDVRILVSLTRSCMFMKLTTSIDCKQEYHSRTSSPKLCHKFLLLSSLMLYCPCCAKCLLCMMLESFCAHHKQLTATLASKATSRHLSSQQSSQH